MMTALKRILLVEDNMNDIELTLSALEKQNLSNNVVVVRDGAAALDYLFRRGRFALREDENPAVVFLDIKMPKVDGLEVLRHIRSEESLRLTPAVMLTSSREEADMLKSYSLGANAYVVKPVDFPSFVEGVGTIGLFWASINEPPPKTSSRRAAAELSAAPPAGKQPETANR